jgi:acetyltransferase-like isoleucine patch superfamily enzyme
MMLFRLRDFASVLFWRMLGFRFGGFGRRVRIVRPRYLDSLHLIRLGDGVALQEGGYITVQPDAPDAHGLSIGSGTLIGNRAHIAVVNNVDIGRDVLIADNVFIADCGHQFDDVSRPIHAQGLVRKNPVHIGDGCWIGEGAVIVGARIGRNSVVGALTTVTRDVPDHCVVSGVPAIILKRFCAKQGAWLRTDPDGRFVEQPNLKVCP